MNRRAASIFALSTAGLLGLVVAIAAPPALAFHSDQGCIQCHVPHGSAGDQTQVPLWNPVHTSTTLTSYYSSPTAKATFHAPDGASVLCLSCHDGSYSLVTSTHVFGPDKAMGDLANSHPISFVYDKTLASADGALVDPTTLPKGVLDGRGEMQCTSCHDPHSSAQQADGYLRWPYAEPGAAQTTTFCRNCHLR